MKTYLQLLYKPFYDLGFVKNYVKDGKGSGTGFLAFLSFILIFAYSLSLAVILSPVYNTEKVSAITDEFFAGFPQLIVHDGELIWPEGTIKSFSLDELTNIDMSGDYDKTLLTVDTQSSHPSVKNIESSVFYMTKTDFYVNNNGQIKNISYDQIQKFTGQNPIDLTSKENRNLMIKYFQSLLTVGIVIIFTFGFLLNWLIYVILAILTRAFSTSIYDTAKSLDYLSVRRLAAVAVAPVLVVLTVIQIILGQPSNWVMWIAALVIGILLAGKYSPKAETKKATPAVKTETSKIVAKPAPAKKATAPKKAVAKKAAPAKKTVAKKTAAKPVTKKAPATTKPVAKPAAKKSVAKKVTKK